MNARPVVVGVAGGSGSGKTTVVRRILESLGSDQVTVLEHDRYYRERNDLRLEERAALNYDHPDSLETDLMVRHLQELREGRAVGDGLPADGDHRRGHPHLRGCAAAEADRREGVRRRG